MSDPKHILFICSWYPNKDAPALGNFIQRHAIAASAHHHVSAVYAKADGRLPEGEMHIDQNTDGALSEFIVYYGRVHSSLPIISKLKKRDAYKAAIKAGVGKAIAQKGKPDLLHVHVIWPAAIAAIALLKEFRIPLVISEHWSGYLPEDGNYKGVVQKNISKQLAEKAVLITVVSAKMEAAMRAHGLGTKFMQLPNTVDTHTFQFAGEAKTGPAFRLLHVSMLVDREKNVSGLLHAMQELSNRPEIVLDIIGDGPERAAHEQQAREAGLSGKTVFFNGYRNAEEIAATMNSSDALVMFSHFEGMPVTIIEAQCCGLPVIATRTGAIAEMVNEKQGILVTPGNTAELVKAITTMAAEYRRFDRKKISEAASATYAMETVGEKLDVLYRSILDAHA